MHWPERDKKGSVRERGGKEAIALGDKWRQSCRFLPYAICPLSLSLTHTHTFSLSSPRMRALHLSEWRGGLCDLSQALTLRSLSLGSASTRMEKRNQLPSLLALKASPARPMQTQYPP